MSASTKKKKDRENSVTSDSNDAEDMDAAICDDELANLKRRVTFPCDLVTSYCDPPNPWAGVPQCTTEELIAAYRISCEKHEVRPIPIVLQQLKGIDLSICNDRYEMLSLRGNKLDCRHMETLEEIFRRVQFKNLDFEDTNMDDDTAISLFDMIEYYETCTRLNIALNSKISCRGWQICSRMMKKTPQLEVLDVRGILFVENYMPVLARALRSGSMLRVIHMENCNISGRNLLILVSALKVNDHLTELFLANNKMVVSDGIQLGSLLKINSSLQLLDLRNNSLGDEGVRHLCDGLYEQTKEVGGLGTLILWSNGLTHVAMEYVASALSRCRHLQTLNLGYNNITNEGAHNLREGLLRNRSLLRLSLQAGKIGCEGAVALAEYIADTKQLLRLDLRENDIKTGGVIALALALKVNESISRLDLDPDIKKDSSIRDYAEQQREFRRQIDQRLVENRRLAQQREEQRLEEEQLRLEIESSSIASSEITLDGVREETLDSPCEPPSSNLEQEIVEGADTVTVNPSVPSSSNSSVSETGPVDIPGAYKSRESEHASPQLGSQLVHSPTDEVVSFLPSTEEINLLSEQDIPKPSITLVPTEDIPSEVDDNANSNDSAKEPSVCDSPLQSETVSSDVDNRSDAETHSNHLSENQVECLFDDVNTISDDFVDNSNQSLVTAANHSDALSADSTVSSTSVLNADFSSGDSVPPKVISEDQNSIKTHDVQQHSDAANELFG